MMNKVKNLVCIISFLILSCKIFATSPNQFLDAKGNLIDLEKISSKNVSVIVFYSDYNCINCINTLKKSLQIAKDSVDIYIMLLTRLNSNFDYLDAILEINKISKIFNALPIFFDIQHNQDKWPPVDIQDGLFGKYKLDKFPAVLVIKGLKEVLLKYDDLFYNNYNSTTVSKLLINAINTVSE